MNSTITTTRVITKAFTQRGRGGGFLARPVRGAELASTGARGSGVPRCGLCEVMTN